VSPDGDARSRLASHVSEQLTARVDALLALADAIGAGSPPAVNTPPPKDLDAPPFWHRPLATSQDWPVGDQPTTSVAAAESRGPAVNPAAAAVAAELEPEPSRVERALDIALWALNSVVRSVALAAVTVSVVLLLWAVILRILPQPARSAPPGQDGVTVSIPGVGNAVP
jgi:hypothetical protein